jgi:hypothetical protein
MMSDSILVWGHRGTEIIPQLARLYENLFDQGLLLRGAIVSGTLEIDPRVTLDNFDKMMPANDALARAVGLESSYKGARYLLDTPLATQLLSPVRAWLTHDGYVRDPQVRPRQPQHDILRRICPTPDNSHYEYLHFWSVDPQPRDYGQRKRELKEISQMLRSDIAEHYKETIALLERSQSREKFTDEA